MKKVSLLLSIIMLSNLLLAQNLPAGQAGTQPGCYPYPKTISVNGSAEMEVIPDEIYVQVDLREYKKKNENKIELETIKAAFLASCKAVGIADSNISVASYDGYNMANIWRRKKKDPELLASIAYQVKFNNAKLIDDLVNRLDDEATNNFRIVKTSHSKITAYRKQLKISAVKAAKEKATYLTESVNEQLGQAITIVEPEEYVNSDVQAGLYKSNVPLYENVSLKEARAYGINDNGVDYRKIKLRFEVKVLYALK